MATNPVIELIAMNNPVMRTLLDAGLECYIGKYKRGMLADSIGSSSLDDGQYFFATQGPYRWETLDPGGHGYELVRGILTMDPSDAPRMLASMTGIKENQYVNNYYLLATILLQALLAGQLTLARPKSLNSN